MTRPTGTGGKARPLTRDEVERIDKCLTGTTHELRNRALFYLGLGTGMRVGELVGLRVGDVVRYGKVLDHVVLERHSTKGKQSRTVHLTPQAIGHIKAYVALLSDTDEGAPMFGSQRRRNEPLTANAAVKTLKGMFEAAGVANVSSHSLRRTHANELRRTGADLKLIQEQLGHRSLATTERYFDVDPLEKRAALAKVTF